MKDKVFSPTIIRILVSLVLHAYLHFYSSFSRGVLYIVVRNFISLAERRFPSVRLLAMEARSIPGIVVMAASSLLFLGLLAYLADMSGSRSTGIITTWLGIQEEGTPNITLPTRRKLLGGSEKKEVNRIWGEQKCRKEDIVIRQGATAPLASGVPTYTVEVTNMCGNGGCDISGIHVSCGWFSSARLINPKVFKRLRYNDCLLNDGRALAVGATLSFQYANTFPYPLAVSSVSCPP